MRITDRLASEHGVFRRELEMLEWLLRSDASVEAIVAAVRTLALPLLSHAEDEEVRLFPALRAELGEGGPLAVLVEEHVMLQRQLERMTDDPPRMELVALLPAFAALLRSHMVKEEDTLFPVAERLLGDERLRELDLALPTVTEVSYGADS